MLFFGRSFRFSLVFFSKPNHHDLGAHYLKMFSRIKKKNTNVKFHGDHGWSTTTEHDFWIWYLFQRINHRTRIYLYIFEKINKVLFVCFCDIMCSTTTKVYDVQYEKILVWYYSVQCSSLNVHPTRTQYIENDWLFHLFSVGVNNFMIVVMYFKSTCVS